ncbi:TraI domain-containing protein [Ruminobacter sp.]|uniref:TraI domain-containing protein n=1 Tax=Ruminobacter sp. TaxID=2774296 RepID=UPI00386F4A9A
MNIITSGLSGFAGKYRMLKALLFPERTVIHAGSNHEYLKNPDACTRNGVFSRGSSACGSGHPQKLLSGQAYSASASDNASSGSLHRERNGIISVDDILEIHAGLIAKIRDLLPLEDSEFNTILLPLLKNFINFAYTLPASEYYHHHNALGLVTHSMETVFFALRGLFDECFDFGLPGDRRTLRETRVAACTFVAALLHDVGKPLTDVIIRADAGEFKSGSSSPSVCREAEDAAGTVWNPMVSGLHDFLISGGYRSYFFEYVPMRGKRHEQLAVIAANRVIPKEFISWMLAEPDLLEHLYAALSCDRTSVFYDAVKRADIMSVRYHLSEVRLGGLRRNDCVGTESVPAPAPLTEKILISNRMEDILSDGSGKNASGKGIKGCARGILSLILELLQQKIADSQHPANAEDSCLFFTDRECLLSLNPHEFFDMTAPLRGTGTAMVINDSMELYEKLILMGIGEYADAAATVILHRILVSFDGIKLREIHGLKIIKPEYLYGGIRPAPIKSYGPEMLYAFDAVRAGRKGLSINGETVGGTEDCAKGTGGAVTIDECLALTESRLGGTADHDNGNRSVRPDADVAGEVSGANDAFSPDESPVKDSDLRENASLTGTVADGVSLPAPHKGNGDDNDDGNSLDKGNGEREVQALAHVDAHSRSPEKDGRVKASRFLLNDNDEPVLSVSAGGGKSGDGFLSFHDIDAFSERQGGFRIFTGKTGRAKGRNGDDNDHYPGLPLSTELLPDNVLAGSPAGSDWLENPMRITRAPSRPRDAHGRFVKTQKGKDKGSADLTTATGTSISAASHDTSPGVNETPISDSLPEKNMDTGVELKELTETVLSFDDMRLNEAVGAFTLRQLDTLASRLIKKMGKGRSSSRRRKKAGGVPPSQNGEGAKPDVSGTSASEKKLFMRVAHALRNACANALSVGDERDDLSFVSLSVDEISGRKPGEVTSALLAMTELQKLSLLKKIKEKSVNGRRKRTS